MGVLTRRWTRPLQTIKNMSDDMRSGAALVLRAPWGILLAVVLCALLLAPIIGWGVPELVGLALVASMVVPAGLWALSRVVAPEDRIPLGIAACLGHGAVRARGGAASGIRAICDLGSCCDCLRRLRTAPGAVDGFRRSLAGCCDRDAVHGPLVVRSRHGFIR